MMFIIKKNTILFHKIYHNYYLNIVVQINYNNFYADVMDIVAFLMCSWFTS